MENQTQKHKKSITEPFQTVFSINGKDGTYLQLVYTIIFLESRTEMIFWHVQVPVPTQGPAGENKINQRN